MSTTPSNGDDGTTRQDDALLSQEELNANVGSDSPEWGSGRYKPLSEIGIGAYGVVFKAKDLQNQRDDGIVAMKCLRVENTEQGIPLSMVREIALLKQLETKDHPNVVKLLDICLGRQTLYETQLMLVFEHVDQDLDMFLKKLPEAGLEPSFIKNIMHQILLGLDFLHSMRVIHRDLKPQNILITSSGRIKIADFGLARIFSFEMALTDVVVTLWYRAPEVLLRDSYASPVDLWSVGCIFAELYNRKPLFRGTGDVNQLKKIFDFIGRPSEEEWPLDVAIPITSFPPQSSRLPQQFVPGMESTASDLFVKLLTFNPDHRPTPQKALEHIYFQEICAAQTGTDEETLSNAVEKVLEQSFVAESRHRRMAYTQQMGAASTSGDIPTFSSRAYDPRYGYDVSHEGHDCPDSSATVTRHSTVTPGLEQVRTVDTPERPSTLHQGRRRMFGDPLPVNVKDGASGQLLSPAENYQESAFLTPPSDLASSSSGVATPSSSRCSSTSSDGPHHPVPSSEAAQQSSAFSIETSICHSTSTTPSLEAPEPKPVIKRTRKESEGQSRMSWTFEPILIEKSGDDHNESKKNIFESSQFVNASYKPKLKTPTYQILESGKYVPCMGPPTTNVGRDTPLPSGGHSSQGSYSSCEGDSQSSLPPPEK